MKRKLMLGDCLERMKEIPDKSVDMCLTDPPYGTTACKWDTVIPFEPMWNELYRIVKDNGAICLFGSEPFSSALRMSNIKMFKYDWYLNKNNPTGNLNANKMPMRKIEILSVFNSRIYYPQGLKPYNKINKRGKINKTMNPNRGEQFQKWTNYPVNLIEFKREYKNRYHPTQKPVTLLEYLIKTYTLEGETVLDFTMGSGSTGVACVNLKRKFIGIEKDEKYFDIAVKRIEEIKTQESD
jgi:site-specific DNA-methyltransferase (adenine-specific)